MLDPDGAVGSFRQLNHPDAHGSGLIGFKQGDFQFLCAHQCIRQQLIVQVYCIPGLVVFLGKGGAVSRQGQYRLCAGNGKFSCGAALHQPGNFVLIPHGSALQLHMRRNSRVAFCLFAVPFGGIFRYSCRFCCILPVVSGQRL